MDRPKCEKCEKTSTITVQASGHFCRECFIVYFRHKFRRILGASKLIRSGDRVALAYDGSRASACILDILTALSKGDTSNPKFLKKNRYDSIALHLSIDETENEKITELFSSSTIETHIQKVSKADLDSVRSSMNEFERFNDETESLYNNGQLIEELLVRHCAELNIQHVIMATIVDGVAADALTNLCLGFGKGLAQSAGLSRKAENGVTVLRPFREVTKPEIDYYCEALELEHQKEESTANQTKSVQGLAALFMTNLAILGQKSNPSAMIRMAEKIKAKK